MKNLYHKTCRLGIAALILGSSALFVQAKETIPAREGWQIHESALDFQALKESLRAAVADNKMIVVYTASASKAAKGRGVDIPGNAVFGIYRNDFAVRMLAADIAAGIEAPIVIYVTDDGDGTATLSYKTPSAVFSPYFADGGEPLEAMSAELDAIFDAIAAQAVQ
ncbi:MAG: DUF302 domain-containing protein [Neomegalonema sp.]|nr:DUF302 domain-containing protein [Neomegalonema sp.]